MQRSPSRPCSLLAAALWLASPGAAQDSTAINPGLPGDSLDAHDAGEQCNDFIAELSVLETSFGNTFGVAPLLKASMDFAPSPNFFNARIGAQAISADVRQGVPFARPSYDRWTAPGFGINAQANNAGAPVDTSSAVGSQFAVAFMEQSSDDPAGATLFFDNIIGAVVNFDPVAPSRLHVSRVVAATNGPDWNCNLAQFGMGTVDSHGFVHFRSDGFGAGPCGPFSEITGDNYFRTSLLGRNCGAQNVISSTGGADATTWVLAGATVVHNVPNIVPAAVTGAASILIGSNFSGQFVYGVNTLSATNTHLGGGTDHRGAVAYTAHSFPSLFGGAAVNGTGGILSKSGSPTDRFSLFGIGSGGAPVGAISRQLPAALTDPETGFSGGGQLAHVFSQTAFRGGSSQLALGRDQAGRLLAAAVANHGTVSFPADHPKNMIAVARVSSTGTDWSVAAYTDGVNGKPIQDGSGATIGRLVEMNVVSNFFGPSISPPMIDSVGNVLFVASFQLFTGPQGLGLFRAVYDPASFSYRLELLLRSGQVLRGANSGLDYLVRFITLASANSISSGAPFSHNLIQQAYNGADPATLETSDAHTVGGMVLNVNLIYDVNGDGVFETLNTNPGTLDQEYNVLLYIAPAEDCNGNGVPDDLDILFGTSMDLNGDGVPDECGAAISYCFGDGSGTFCPCGNFGATNQGCANSTGQGGVLTATGSGSVSAADTVLAGSNLVPGAPGLYFQGNEALGGGNGVAFGDGLRCAGIGVVRLQVLVADPSGSSMTTVDIASEGGVQAGQTRRYQLWYRDPVSSPCGSTFNLTTALEVVWTP